MTTHIQIMDVAPRIQYTGNGAQTSFTYPFAIFSPDQLHVFTNGAELLSGFTVMNAGSTTGGTVIFDTAPLSGIRVTLERILPLQRISDFIEGGELSANALNNEFDYLTASVQQIQDDQSALIGFTKTENIPLTELPGKSARSNKVLGFDGNGDLSLYESSNTYNSPSNTQSGTGAVARTLVDKAKEFVSVKDFGATGDGTTNDRTAIVNALAAHSHVYFPPGTYRITSGIEVGDNKILCGAGVTTIIKASVTTFDTISMIGKNAQIKDMVIDTGDSALRLYGKAAPCTGNTLQNLVIRNANIGIELDGYINTANPCDGNHFTNIIIEKPAQYGVLVTRSGVGKHPNSNQFTGIRVSSQGTAISGAGFFMEAAKYNNALINCEAYLSGSPSACFRVGSGSDKTLIINAYCETASVIPNILLDNGSVETSIVNLFSNSAGSAIEDFSGGNYMALNAGFPFKNKLSRTMASDLTIAQKRLSFESVAFASPNTVTVDLSKSTYLVSAASAVTTVQLPKAAAANSGAVIIIKKTDGSANAVQVTEASGSGPDGMATNLSTSNSSITVISNGGNWYTIAKA